MRGVTGGNGAMRKLDNVGECRHFTTAFFVLFCDMLYALNNKGYVTKKRNNGVLTISFFGSILWLERDTFLHFWKLRLP
jgi:hypothetical protein